jgi:DNA repair protein RadC
MNSPDAIARHYRHLEKYDREHMIRLDLDNQNRLIGEETVSIGTADTAIISPREIFRGALLSGATRIILLHNHPSGNPSPSKEDISIKSKLAKAGEMIDILLLDFIVIGENGTYESLN